MNCPLGIAVLVLSAAYAGLLLWLRRGVRKAHELDRRLPAVEVLPRVTVVVPARDEERHLDRCLRALSGQDYPAGLLEVVVVDDRSRDATPDIIARYVAAHSNFRSIRIENVPPGVAPKKHALHQGIQAASGEIVLTTDADCEPPPTWVRSMAARFTPDTGMVLGFSPLTLGRLSRLADGLFRLDSLALASLAAAGVGVGYPLTCSGRNLGYRKNVYNELGGFGRYQAIGSGDDDLFLARVRDETHWGIRYAFDPASQVPAEPPTSLRALWNQRTRHASKGVIYARPITAGLVGVYLYNLAFLVLGWVSFWVGAARFFFLLSWLLKSGSEWLLLGRTARYLKFRAPLFLIPLVSVFHALYVTVFGLAGQFRSFEWKGHRYRPATHLGGLD